MQLVSTLGVNPEFNLLVFNPEAKVGTHTYMFKVVLPILMEYIVLSCLKHFLSYEGGYHVHFSKEESVFKSLRVEGMEISEQWPVFLFLIKIDLLYKFLDNNSFIFLKLERFWSLQRTNENIYASYEIK